jgi:hypothetical protein
LAEPIEEKIALDREQPSAHVSAPASQVPAADRARQTILDKIVGGIIVSQESPGVTPECWDVRLEKSGNLVHGSVIQSTIPYVRIHLGDRRESSIAQAPVEV